MSVDEGRGGAAGLAGTTACVARRSARTGDPTATTQAVAPSPPLHRSTPAPRTGKFWTVDEVAELLQLSRQTICRAVRSGQLHGGKQTWFRGFPNGPRYRRQRWMIADDSLAAWIETRGLAEWTGAKLSTSILYGLEPDEAPALERLMKISPLIGRMFRAFHQLRPIQPRK
jgi:Helix-turn-helix domain